jgi:hypothetical protein
MFTKCGPPLRKTRLNNPQLAKITDDNNDKVIEVNRPEEIDALIASISKMLKI